MARFAFHPDALLEYADATNYYLGAASPAIAEQFVAAVESAVAIVVADPARCPIVEQPGIRRLVFRRFPYVLYYRWEAEREFVSIFAVMHCSRDPGYWKKRVA